MFNNIFGNDLLGQPWVNQIGSYWISNRSGVAEFIQTVNGTAFEAYQVTYQVTYQVRPHLFGESSEHVRP